MNVTKKRILILEETTKKCQTKKEEIQIKLIISLKEERKK